MRNLILAFTFTFLLSSCSSFKISQDYVFPNKKEKAIYIKSYNETLKLWEVPFKEIDIKTSYGLAHIITCGPETGKPMILFHGTDASSTMWFPNVKEFSKEYRVYAIDFPLEAGKSISNRRKFSNKDTALFYNEVFNILKLKNITLVGVSRGGWVSTFLAVQPNNNITNLVLLSPAQTFGGIAKLGKVLSGLKLKLFPTKKNADKFFDCFSYQPSKIDSHFQEQLYFAYKYGNSKPRILNMTKFSKKELSRLKMPVLILIGDHDIVNTEKIFIKAHKFIPKVETEVIKDAGHFLSIDQYEIINKKIIDFLNKN